MHMAAVVYLAFSVNVAKAKYFLVKTADNGAISDYCEVIIEYQEIARTAEKG